ncbi:hypothetical protein ACVIHI_000113 [Bradyrhizobium sp. USDA 4524]|nr:hypothetical protein [Bradyrhizobium sp. USDA 4538]MCP1899087.1 hypothetical protein [Bradyrhizobium sp. USDA 4537]MCP1986800.1 hypothetical protein [Bradyrhizobium sp. USDA 4539]
MKKDAWTNIPPKSNRSDLLQPLSLPCSRLGTPAGRVYSAVRREGPIRTFNDWHDPPPGFCEVDVVAHGGTSVAGSFIQTVTMVDVATGWTECMPLV